jgi:hypothetical protein
MGPSDLRGYVTLLLLNEVMALVYRSCKLNEAVIGTAAVCAHGMHHYAPEKE